MDRNHLGVCLGIHATVALRKESVDRNWPVCTVQRTEPVALRKESVDRNVPIDVALVPIKVALRKESVDRNCLRLSSCLPVAVALRKESVDRNTGYICGIGVHSTSLSARRAWIEISALADEAERIRSLSARRAWIEIAGTMHLSSTGPVALRKESVDRNQHSP